MRIKEFLLNSQHQVVCKVVREVLNLFKMELPVPVEKLPYRKSPEKQAELISNAAYDILELKIENFTESVPGETTSSLTERPGELPVVRTMVHYIAADGSSHDCHHHCTGKEADGPAIIPPKVAGAPPDSPGASQIPPVSQPMKPLKNFLKTY